MNSGIYRKKPEQKTSTNLSQVITGIARIFTPSALFLPSSPVQPTRSKLFLYNTNSWLPVTGTPISTGDDSQTQLLTERKHLHLYCDYKCIYIGQITSHYQVLPSMG